MSINDHYCPDISPNNTTPNIPASRCASRMKNKQGKCAKCPDGIGYVAPVPKERKKITERLWKNPNEEKRVYTPRMTVQRSCICGAKVETCKTYCEDCRVKNLAVSLAKTRLKFLLKQRDKLNTQIANVRKIIKREI